MHGNSCGLFHMNPVAQRTEKTEEIAEITRSAFSLYLEAIPSQRNVSERTVQQAWDSHDDG